MPMELPHFTTIVRETWLTRKPDPNAIFVANLVSTFVTLASLVYWLDLWGASAWMPASGETVFARHEYWRLWTTLFAHADIAHLLSNVFLFYLFGFFLGGHFGGFVFPGAALFFGGITNALVLKGMPSQVELIGISGVLYWMGAAWLILYFLIERRFNTYKRALRTLGVAILLFVPMEAFDPSISYAAHFVGFALGIAWGLLYYRIFRRRFHAAERSEIIFEEELENQS